jgi:hypothetical protein
MLETGGAKEIEIDYAAKTATMKVPAAVTDDMATKAVSGRFTAKVHQ